jgi:transcriptional regulator with XRE-family HTH domain
MVRPSMGRSQAQFLSLLGLRLRDLRQGRELTQEALGERAGFTGKYVSEVERGLRDLPLSTLRAIAGSLGASMEDVFRGVEDGRSVGREPAPLPAPFSREVLGLVRALTQLSAPRRRRVLAAMRAMVQAARD